MKRLVAVLVVASCSSREPIKPTPSSWPSPDAWKTLASQLTGKLVQPTAATPSKNPWALQDDPAATQSTGWIDAWTAVPSTYVVAAENASDVSAAVKFARANHVPLVVRGTGHDYLGRSTRPNSLMVWTHAMRAIAVDDAFVPHGCSMPAMPAVNIGAGARWGEAYEVVTTQHHRYVQGGGCLSVGVAGGFLQGGGFGSYSRKFGTAAASLLEAEVVTADGQIRIANACQNQDLFWALRGGGGGTFGVVTRVTLMTHPLPETFGIARGTITAHDPEAFRALVAEFLTFYRDHLDNEHWGESINLAGNVLSLSLSFEGLSQDEVDHAWQPFRDWLAHHHELDGTVEVHAFPFAAHWNPALLRVFPDVIRVDDRPNAPTANFWWTGDSEQIGAYWYAYQSRWLPRTLLGDIPRLAGALAEASHHWSVGIHFNKALAAAAPDALARSRATATNPAVYDATALVIIAALADGPPDRARGAKERSAVAAAMKPIHDLAPTAGAYVNEADYFEPDWQRAFWGDNYARLLAIKRTYDPTGLFTCHHCVGSE